MELQFLHKPLQNGTKKLLLIGKNRNTGKQLTTGKKEPIWAMQNVKIIMVVAIFMVLEEQKIIKLQWNGFANRLHKVLPKANAMLDICTIMVLG